MQIFKQSAIGTAVLLIAAIPASAQADDNPRGACEPACGKQNVECLVGQPAYANRLPVGRLRILDTSCTAWIIAAPNVLMTNAHCNPGFVFGLAVDFNDECDQCTGGQPKTVDTYDVTEFIQVNQALDYALFLVDGDPASVWGVASVDDAPPEVGQAIYEIHHGNGLPKGYDAGEITSVDVPGTCIFGTAVEIGVSAIATGGASGSPIYSAQTNCVVGICHCGPPCAAGYGIPMSAILADALPYIQSAGGQVVMCNETCAGPDGDMNVDGIANGLDIQAFIGAVLGIPTPAQICHGDFNGDGGLDESDVFMFVAVLVSQ